MAEARTILVTGATGKQGHALIKSLLDDVEIGTETSAAYHVLALTRHPSSVPARKLKERFGDKVTVTEGNLDDPVRVRQIFAEQRDHGSIWGVFAVLAYPGLGTKSENEERQGKMLADLALEFDVQVFIYSSSLQVGIEDDDTQDYSHKAKLNIEHYCENLGSKGLNYVIVRPGFFMENFDGPLGALAVTIFSHGLHKDTTIALVASEDIGKVVSGCFKDHNRFLHKAISITSGAATMTEITESYQRAMEKPMPRAPAILGILLLKINSGAQKIVEEIKKNHEARCTGQMSSFERELDLARSLCEMQTFYEWKLKNRPVETGSARWNQVSLLKMFSKRS